MARFNTDLLIGHAQRHGGFELSGLQKVVAFNIFYAHEMHAARARSDEHYIMPELVWVRADERAVIVQLFKWLNELLPAFGEPTGWYDSPSVPLDEATTQALVRQAEHNGITVLDNVNVESSGALRDLFGKVLEVQRTSMILLIDYHNIWDRLPPSLQRMMTMIEGRVKVPNCAQELARH